MIVMGFTSDRQHSGLLSVLGSDHPAFFFLVHNSFKSREPFFSK